MLQRLGHLSTRITQSEMKLVAQTETDNQLKKTIQSSAILDHSALATRNLYIATFLGDFCPSMMASDDYKVIKEGNKAVSYGDVWMDRLLWTQKIRNDPRVYETLYGLSPNEVEAYENDPRTLVCLTAHANLINGRKDFQPTDDFHTAFDRYVIALREGGFRVSYHDEPESKEKRAQDDFWMVYASNAKKLTAVRDREQLGRTNKRQILKSRIVDVQSSKNNLSFYHLPTEIRLSIYNFVFCDQYTYPHSTPTNDGRHSSSISTTTSSSRAPTSNGQSHHLGDFPKSTQEMGNTVDQPPIIPRSR
ncbi:MAG: hypothetical protein Q9178_007516 [Gyalolechia marmorata]